MHSKVITDGLKSLRENSSFTNLVPKGRLNLAQDASPGLELKGRPSPAGTAEDEPRRNSPSAVPAGLNHVSLMDPGLASWAKFSRPFGTKFLYPEFSRRLFSPCGSISLSVLLRQLNLRGGHYLCSINNRPNGVRPRLWVWVTTPRASSNLPD